MQTLCWPRFAMGTLLERLTDIKGCVQWEAFWNRHYQSSYYCTYCIFTNAGFILDGVRLCWDAMVLWRRIFPALDCKLATDLESRSDLFSEVWVSSCRYTGDKNWSFIAWLPARSDWSGDNGDRCDRWDFSLDLNFDWCFADALESEVVSYSKLLRTLGISA